MTMTVQEAVSLTQHAVKVFDVLSIVRDSVRLAESLWSSDKFESLCRANEQAATSVSYLVMAVESGIELRENLSTEVLLTIAAAGEKQEPKLPRLADGLVCCHEVAKSVIPDVMLAFESKLLNEGGFALGSSWMKDSSSLRAFAERIGDADEQSATHVVNFISESLEATGYSNEDFDLFRSQVIREGAALVAELRTKPRRTAKNVPPEKIRKYIAKLKADGTEHKRIVELVQIKFKKWISNYRTPDFPSNSCIRNYHLEGIEKGWIESPIVK